MRILQLEDFTREDMKVEVENELATFIGLLDVDRSQWPSKEFELDDGWPESVKEQGLLLLVWRHHIAKQYIKDVL